MQKLCRTSHYLVRTATGQRLRPWDSNRFAVQEVLKQLKQQEEEKKQADAEDKAKKREALKRAAGEAEAPKKKRRRWDMTEEDTPQKGRGASEWDNPGVDTATPSRPKYGRRSDRTVAGE